VVTTLRAALAAALLAGFYLLAFGIIGGLGWLAVWMWRTHAGAGAGKLSYLVLALAAGVVVALWKVVRSKPEPPEGVVLDERQAPELWATVRELAGVVQTRTPDEIRLVAEVNAAGGVLGKPLEVVVEDDQGTPSVATTAARKLLQRDRVDVVFGTITGDTTIAVKQLATQAKVPFMKAILDDYLHSPLCSRYFFKLGESDYQLLEPLAPFMVERFGRRVALVGSDYSFPHSYNQTAKPLLSAAGAQVVAEEYAPLGTAEWSSVIGKLKGARPDFVLSSVVGGDAIALLKQAQSLGLLKSSEITGVSINQEFYPAVPTLMNGRWGTFRYSDQLDNAANRKFVADYRAKYSDDAPIPSVTANSYVGVHLLAKAVGAAGGTDADKIVAALAAVKLADTVYGPEEISFDPGNQVLNTNIYLAQIASGGKYTISRGAGVTADPTKC